MVDDFMYRSSLFLTTALIGTTVSLIQPATQAKSVVEIERVARDMTVEIKLQQNGSVGSGVMIDRKGDLYTLVTNAHVVCGNEHCSKLPAGESYRLGLVDGQQYQVNSSSIKLLKNNLDLAIIQFRSNRNYIVAKIAPLGNLKVDDPVFTAGFPFEQPGFSFNEGKTIAVVEKRLTGDSGGYTIIYNAFTQPGMSGGGVFNSGGELVAIHGQGDRFRENTDLDNKSRAGNKIGYNRGISVRWLVQNLTEVGINIRTSGSISDAKDAHSQLPTTADEYFIAGFNKLIEPGNNVMAGKQQAIQEFSRAIQLNSRYQYAYLARAIAYIQVKEFQPSLADFNQAIKINPKDSVAYNNRAILKEDKLTDTKGALTDFNQAITINPKYYAAYYNRAILKDEKLNDVQNALADFNQAIIINPRYFDAYNNRANLKKDKVNDIQGALFDFNQAIKINPEFPEAYYNRGALKYENLNDRAGAIQDLRQAAKLFRKQGNKQRLQVAIRALKQLGATE
jgi:tetratricopeptide (TPR) repeat protein